MTIPPHLKKGDLISIVAPAGKVNPEYVLRARSVLENWGFKIDSGKFIFNQYGRFAGAPEERLSDLQQALDNVESKAIFCARGGYGVVHLLENLSLKSFKKNPQWVIGYSDISALHAQINNAGICSIHAPMSSHLSETLGDDKASDYLKQILFGQFPFYEVAPHPLNHAGNTKGILRGGNLSVLSSLRGTPYDFPVSNTILFIEDVGEKPYHIERMMYNLKLGKVLERISGLIVGQFADCEEDGSMNKTIYESIADLVADYDYPVCFNFPAGHVKHNYPLILGKIVELQISRKTIVLK